MSREYEVLFEHIDTGEYIEERVSANTRRMAERVARARLRDKKIDLSKLIRRTVRFARPS